MSQISRHVNVVLPEAFVSQLEVAVGSQCYFKQYIICILIELRCFLNTFNLCFWHLTIRASLAPCNKLFFYTVFTQGCWHPVTHYFLPLFLLTVVGIPQRLKKAPDRALFFQLQLQHELYNTHIMGRFPQDGNFDCFVSLEKKTLLDRCGQT